jgi:PhnB protein
MIEVSPALVFCGECEEAFGFYRSVFGGEYQFLYRYEDIPGSRIAKEDQKKILHVSLPLMKNVNLMGMDDIKESSPDADPGSSSPDNADPTKTRATTLMSIGLRLNEEAETIRLFDALAMDGKVTMPLAKTFYADLYGNLIDRYKVNWSFNCNIGRESLV